MKRRDFDDQNQSRTLIMALDSYTEQAAQQNVILRKIYEWLLQSGNRVENPCAEPVPVCLPVQLTGERANLLLESLVAAGLVNDDWQPIGLSGPERGLLAKAVCERLNINDVWQVFGRLWNMNAPTLRNYFNKAFDLKKSLAFQERLKCALR